MAQAEVDRSSLRAVAEKIGLSHGALHNFLAGSTPYASTLDRIERWLASGRVSDRALVEAFLAATPPEVYGARAAGKLIGVSHDTVASWRRGEIAELRPATRLALREFVERHAAGGGAEAPGAPVEPDALLLIADMFEEMAGRLRAHARGGTTAPPEGVDAEDWERMDQLARAHAERDQPRPRRRASGDG